MRWGVSALALSLAGLGLAGCVGTTPSPASSCLQAIVQDDATYRFVEPQPSGIAPAEAVGGASYLSCDDGGGLSGGGPVEAWRASGLGTDYLVTMTACARLEGTTAASDCDPDAPRYVLWTQRIPAP